MENNKPIKEFKSGGLKLSIWSEKVTTNEESYISYNIKINKRYLDKNKEWKTTDNFKVNDLPKVRILSEMAYIWLTVKESELQTPEDE